MRLIKRTRFSNKERSLKSERELAKLVNGRVQPASGAIDRADLKADVKSRFHLIDDKVTGKGSYSIARKLWRVLGKQAWQNRLKPALRINFEGDFKVYVISEQDFLVLQEALEAGIQR